MVDLATHKLPSVSKMNLYYNNLHYLFHFLSLYTLIASILFIRIPFYLLNTIQLKL